MDDPRRGLAEHSVRLLLVTRFRATATAVGAAVAAIALTAGCAAGKQAQTAYEKPSIDGAQGVVGDIQLESVALHAPSGSSYAKGATVPLTVYFANNGTSDDTLTKISSASFPGGYSISTSSSSSSGAPRPQLPVRRAAPPVTKITFTFAKAGQTTVTVPVQTTNEPDERTLPAGSASASG